MSSKTLDPLYNQAQNLLYRGSNKPASKERHRSDRKTVFDYEDALVDAMKSFFENDFETQSMKEALAQIRRSGLSSFEERLSTGEPYMFRKELNISFKMCLHFLNSQKTKIVISVIKVKGNYKKGGFTQSKRLTSKCKGEKDYTKRSQLERSIIDAISALEQWYNELG